MEERHETLVAVTKGASVWAAVGITSWSEAAAAAAFCYTVILICEWVWKRLLRPMLERRGVIAPKAKAEE